MTCRVVAGDCRDVLRTLAAGSVHCCVTSPPYFGLRDYGVAGQIGLEPSLAEYVAELVAVFREVRRVLRDDGTCWLNLGDGYARAPGKGRHKPGEAGLQNYIIEQGNGRAAGMCVPAGLKPKDLMMVPARVALALQDDGWFLRSDIIWSKPNPMPESVTDRPTSAHEHIFLLTKAARYFFDAEAVREVGTIPAGTLGAKGSEERFNTPGVNSRPPEYKVYSGTRNIRNVWEIATEPFPGAHFATMPTALVERCIKAGTSGRGCCPACGAPWGRVIGEPQATGGRGSGNKDRFVAGVREDGQNRGRLDTHLGSSIPWSPTVSTTTGWRPTCGCPEAPPVPAVVLDCFSGAGTTCLVADRLQRNGIGIDLSEEYCRMARERLGRDAPLLSAGGVAPLFTAAV